MIYLHTGQPGAGKTLFTLDIVKKRAESENRPVFYAGIEILQPEVFPGWQKLEEPEKWFECPDGSIIVHDECQTLYRPRGNGTKVPEYVARFETHRHQGLDIYLITQHPMLVDGNIRRLAGEHVHVVRAFGSKAATLHKWAQVKENCDKSRADASSTTRAYPKQLFGAYQSATIHTHKRSIPPRLYFLMALPLLLGLCIWMFYGWYSKQSAPAGVPASVGVPGSAGGAAAPSPARGGRGDQPARKSTAEWVAERQPRVQGLPQTAPVYDRVTQVVRAPYPAVCLASMSRCKCYTQQATPLSVPDELCRQIARDGFFMDWEVEGAGKAERRAAEPTGGMPSMSMVQSRD